MNIKRDVNVLLFDLSSYLILIQYLYNQHDILTKIIIIFMILSPCISRQQFGKFFENKSRPTKTVLLYCFSCHQSKLTELGNQIILSLFKSNILKCGYRSVRDAPSVHISPAPMPPLAAGKVLLQNHSSHTHTVASGPDAVTSYRMQQKLCTWSTCSNELFMYNYPQRFADLEIPTKIYLNVFILDQTNIHN